MRLKSLIIIAVMIKFSAASLAQSITQTSVPTFNVVPPSPQGAAFLRYGEIPVSLNTGIPNISIPLYTINLKGIQVPITLSYHAGGIRVDDMATNVGLGWSLNTGGSITSSVNGVPDEEGNGWLHCTTFPQTGEFRTNWWNETTNSWDAYGSDSAYFLMLNAATGLSDTQPDLYYLNMNGRSVKYFYDQSHNIHLMPYQKIDVSNDTTFIDESNNHFNYGVVEVATTHYTYSGMADFPDAPPSTYPNNTRYLSSITTPYGENVTYFYGATSYQFNNQTSETRYASITTESNPFCPTPPHATTNSYTTVWGQRIEKIIATGGVEIDFTYGLTRSDLPGTSALTKIEVKNSITGIILNTFILTYDYYTCTGLSGAGASSDAYKLRLLSVKKNDENPTTFEYNTGAIPKRLNKGQDHWGYYNGSDPSTLLPYDILNGFSTGADRSPNPATVQNGILKKITYPTGGNSLFVYEPNVFSTYKFGHYEPVQHSASAYGVADSIVTQSFTLGSDRPGDHPPTFFFHSATGDEYHEETDSYETSTVRLRDASGTIMQTYHGTSLSIGIHYPVYLEPGTYTLEVESSAHYSDAYFTVVWYENEYFPPTTVNRVIAGLRVKEIANQPVTGTSVTKYYEYNKLDSVGQSSAVEGPIPVYSYFFTKINPPNELTEYTLAQYCTKMAQSGNLVSTSFPVKYANVTEYTDTKQKGYTTHVFTAFEGFGDTMYPFKPVINNDWVDGLPLSTIDYKWDNGIFRPIKKVINTYKLSYGVTGSGYPNESIVRGAKVVIKSPEHPLPSVAGIPASFDYVFYYLNSSWSYPTSKTETVYDPIDTTKKVVTEERYFYDNPDHIQRTRTEISRSTGEHYVVGMRYAGDMTTPIAANPTKVVEKRVTISNGSTERLVDADITLYDGLLPISYYGLKSTGTVTPGSVALFTGSTIPTGYEKRSDYTYDTNGNMVKILKDEVQATSYQWGYNHEYPVAECKNASNTEFYYESFEESTSSGATTGTAHTGKKYSTTSTVTWTPPNSRTYVISYSYLSSGTWLFSGEQAFTGSFTMQSGASGYDDIRIHPTDSQMTTYTYEPLVGMTSSTDAKGQTTYYEYDSFQRLINVKDQDGKILKHTDYHYQHQ